MAFDDLNRVTTITHLGTNDQTLTSLNYTLDDTGRRTAITESTGRSSTYIYDALYRLTGEAIIDPSTGNRNASFTYDAVSNRLTQSVNGDASSYTYDDNDRLTSHGLDTYTHDNNGNTISEVVEGQSNTYSYDSQNRLVSANMGGAVQAMSYDPDGIRVSKAIAGVETNYLTDTNRDYAQVLYESSPTTELQYTFGLDLVGLDTGNEHYTYHSDALGSTRLLTNNAGDVADDVRYDAWGEMLAGGDVSENQYLYTGEQFDSGLGKTYLRARYLDSGIGRFSQMDAWKGARLNPTTLNKYLYANGNSVRHVDPSGQFSLVRSIVALGAISTLNSSTGPSFSFSINSIVTRAETFEDRYNHTGKAGMLVAEFKASVPTAYLLGESLAVSEYIDLVKTAGTWDYKNRTAYKDMPEDAVTAFGNFAFGATCAAWIDGSGSNRTLHKPIILRKTRSSVSVIQLTSWFT